jgi:cyclopropane fatty-acyl-phospholipid synthase-like methyltransferase
VLEIGCCQGFATVVLARVADDVIAADKSSEYLAETVERVGNEIPGHEVKFINLDALDPDEEQWKGLVDRTIVFLDINGNRELRSVLKAMRIVLEKLNARLIVVKSQELHQLVKNEENIGEKLDKLLLQN